MMRIALNMLFLAEGVAGTRVYCEGLLRGLAAVDPRNEYYLFTRRNVRVPDLPADRFHHVPCPVGSKGQLWRALWEYGRLPGLARGMGVELLHGLGTVSPRLRTRPFVLTIHDLIFLHFPQSLSPGERLFLRTVTPRMARHADRILVPSHYTAQDVITRCGVSEKRVRIIPYGPGSMARPVTDLDAIRAVQARVGARPPYIISVARGYRHKNLAGLLEAMAHLVRQGDTETQLVLVGESHQTGRENEELTRTLGLTQRVRFTAFLPRDDLNALYTGATVFAFPSLAEGFGLPVLEAMACGTPVVASDAMSIPEVVGDAGLVADARDPAAFADALRRVLRDGQLRETLRTRGHERARELNWEKCARSTLAVYRELA